ncbi:MAG: hypothetical protein FJ076_05430 [Cyanobacteria bacterium K_DeepCast_35m_m1_288]|nr:hypothetical protein [Cyanobacteria bacterium K_DeepCast_35m_m1_288]
MALRASNSDPLALDDQWGCPVPLLGFEAALERSVFRSGLSRSDWLKRLANELHKPQLLPLLWLLPRRWSLSAAQLPPKLQALGGVLERGLLTPALLAALADDLPHLLPAPKPDQPNALSLWSSSHRPPLPRDFATLQQAASAEAESESESSSNTKPAGAALTGGLVWRNVGLSYEQSPQERQRNSLVARVLNRLAANRIGEEPWSFEGCTTSSGWLEQLQASGWQAQAQLRCSVASFGLGASLPQEAGGWSQVPLALPIRTGLLGADGDEMQSLLPHSCLELELRGPDQLLRLQYYQGTEGLCGWEALNDLQRPWQNDHHNGTVHYLGEPYEGERLQQLFNLLEVIALVHNHEASERQLLHGGYGSLGFCIDSSALIQQVMEGRCQLFPVLMGGIWRERLLRRVNQLGTAAAPWREPYRQALHDLPHDGSLHGSAAANAQQRLLACQPLSSPFVLVQQFTPPAQPGSP